MDRLGTMVARLRRKAKVGSSTRLAAPHTRDLLGTCSEALVDAAEARVAELLQQGAHRHGAPAGDSVAGLPVLVAAKAAASMICTVLKLGAPQLHPDAEAQKALASRLALKSRQVGRH